MEPWRSSLSKQKLYTRKLLTRHRAQVALEREEDAFDVTKVRLQRKWFRHGQEMDRMTKGCVT